MFYHLIALSTWLLATPAVDMGPSATVSTQPDVKLVAKAADPIVGKWVVSPAVGPTSRTCTITFSPIAFGKTGRVNPFACHQVEGLGGLDGVSRFTKWERRGDTIVISGIAQPGIGQVHLPRDSGSRRASGVTADDIRFSMKR
ncbi:MAG: hypothetical protein ROR55_17235 [Devosia sp.]